jgi:hypothetical protein
VDYNNGGTMERLPLLPGATLTTTSPGGKVIEETGNNKGVWVAGNARSAGSFSATVKLLYDAATNVAGACAYASNYPPVGKYISGTDLSFTGTPPYEIVLKDSKNGTITRESGSPFSVSASYTVQSFSDKTGAPGKIKCLVPATFTLTASASGFCTGDAGVVFALSGTENGRDYQLLRGATPVRTLQGTGSAATFSGAFNIAGVYTAVSVADADGVYCSVSMAGSRTVSEYPLPAITHSGGNASQTVYQNTAITNITYTASNATGIALSNGSFPTGVAGTANGLVFTISGTPSVAGSFNYEVTASHTNGCAGATSSGTLTVNATTPPGAASTQTWTIGSGTATRIWSDYLQSAPSGCILGNGNNYRSEPAYYTLGIASGGTGYWYNRLCVLASAKTLCPTPWRVPTGEDFIALDIALGGSGVTRAASKGDLTNTYVALWNMSFIGCIANYVDAVGTNSVIWGIDTAPDGTLSLSQSGWSQFAGDLYIAQNTSPSFSFGARCVRN